MAIYVVQPGDTVSLIANEYGVTKEEIIYNNQLLYPYSLAIGQALYISEEVNENRREVNINGYTYPFINEAVLEETLNYLTDLSIFSYGFTREGYLVPPPLPDEPLITAAIDKATRPILTLTPFGEDGQFNNLLISSIVNDMAVQERLINELYTTMDRLGYRGLDIDFEYILAEDRDNFTTFVANTTRYMNERGLSVSVALAPKTSSDQQGLLYGGKDYGGLGVAANSVLLMTYEWGYTFSEPRAVAPIDKVREVLDYAITKIPRAKIDMGIPNYGYDWALPYVKGLSRARTIGNVEAINIAVEYGSTIYFDEVAQAPYFNYTDNGILHEVWFEDVRSMNAKFNLMEEYSLRGLGYWQIMRLFRANWLLLESRFAIEKL